MNGSDAYRGAAHALLSARDQWIVYGVESIMTTAGDVPRSAGMPASRINRKGSVAASWGAVSCDVHHSA